MAAHVVHSVGPLVVLVILRLAVVGLLGQRG